MIKGRFENGEKSCSRSGVRVNSFPEEPGYYELELVEYKKPEGLLVSGPLTVSYSGGMRITLPITQVRKISKRMGNPDKRIPEKIGVYWDGESSFYVDSGPFRTADGIGLDLKTMKQLIDSKFEEMKTKELYSMHDIDDSNVGDDDIVFVNPEDNGEIYRSMSCMGLPNEVFARYVKRGRTENMKDENGDPCSRDTSFFGPASVSLENREK